MDHSIEAQRLFREGYNCSQAVFCAFCDMTGFDIDTAARLSSSFGGGIGRLREVCGAFSGAMLAFGILCGYSDVNDPDKKVHHYEKVLKDVEVTQGVVPEKRTPEFYEKRPCLKIIGEAAAILDEMLAE